MNINMTLLILLLFVGGFIFAFLASRHKSTEHPKTNGFNPKYWIPVWKQKKWFDKVGYGYQCLSVALIMLGATLGIVLDVFIN